VIASIEIVSLETLFLIATAFAARIGTDFDRWPESIY